MARGTVFDQDPTYDDTNYEQQVLVIDTTQSGPATMRPADQAKIHYVVPKVQDGPNEVVLTCPAADAASIFDIRTRGGAETLERGKAVAATTPGSLNVVVRPAAGGQFKGADSPTTNNKGWIAARGTGPQRIVLRSDGSQWWVEFLSSGWTKEA